MKVIQAALLPTLSEIPKSTLIGLLREEYYLFKIRGTERAGPLEKRQSTLACSNSNEPE